MAEEQRCQEGHRLCANNCGFFGSPATMDLCSKCYRDIQLKDEQASSAKIAVEKSLSASPSSSVASPSLCPVLRPRVSPDEPSWAAAKAVVPLPGEASGTATATAGRCTACRKRVGLTGFRCRCGATFCGVHRYPERHGCGFDYKAVGREGIARANPVVKAEKLEKI